jgi:hypothetical protein
MAMINKDPKEPKTPRVTRKQKKIAKMYADNPNWVKEDAMSAYKKGGMVKPKAMYGTSMKPSMMKKGGTKKK